MNFTGPVHRFYGVPGLFFAYIPCFRKNYMPSRKKLSKIGKNIVKGIDKSHSK